MNGCFMVCDLREHIRSFCAGILMLLATMLPLRCWAESNPSATPAAPAEALPIEPPPLGSPLSLVEAQEAKNKASQLFHENKFKEAAELLRIAYLGDPRPILLFNAGQAYRKAEMAQEAVAMYKEFLSLVPDHPLAAETQGYIKDMEALLAAQAHAKEVAFALEERLEEVKTREQQAAEQAAAKLEKEHLATLQTKQALTLTQQQLLRERNKPFYKKPWFWSVTTGGSVVVIAGIAVGAFFLARAKTDAGTVVISQ
jgi:tetratricopeptide (TPR) repeat protein